MRLQHTLSLCSSISILLFLKWIYKFLVLWIHIYIFKCCFLNKCEQTLQLKQVNPKMLRIHREGLKDKRWSQETHENVTAFNIALWVIVIIEGTRTINILHGAVKSDDSLSKTDQARWRETHKSLTRRECEDRYRFLLFLLLLHWYTKKFCRMEAVTI